MRTLGRASRQEPRGNNPVATLHLASQMTFGKTNGAYNDANPHYLKFKTKDWGLLVLGHADSGTAESDTAESGTSAIVRAVIYERKDNKKSCGKGVYGNAKLGWLVENITNQKSGEDVDKTTFSFNSTDAKEVVIKVSDYGVRGEIPNQQILIDEHWVVAYFTRRCLSKKSEQLLRAEADKHKQDAQSLREHIREVMDNVRKDETQDPKTSAQKMSFLLGYFDTKFPRAACDTQTMHLAKDIGRLTEGHEFKVKTVGGPKSTDIKTYTIMPPAGTQIKQFMLQIRIKHKLVEKAKIIVAAIDELQRFHEVTKLGHGDISCGNMCVREIVGDSGKPTYKVTLIDFDSADEGTKYVTRTQTEAFTAPIINIRPTIEQSDIIALATCLHIKNGETYLVREPGDPVFVELRDPAWSLLTAAEAKELGIAEILEKMKNPEVDPDGYVTTNLDDEMNNLKNQLQASITELEQETREVLRPATPPVTTIQPAPVVPNGAHSVTDTVSPSSSYRREDFQETGTKSGRDSCTWRCPC